jgi:hypothetical protein
MQLIAESREPAAVPYIHLGYLAATTTAPNQAFGALGLTFCLMWGVLVVRSFAAWLGGRLMPSARRPRELKSVRVIGYGALAAAMVSFLLAFETGEQVFSHPEYVTEARLRGAGQWLHRHLAGPRKAGNPLPVEVGDYDARSMGDIDDEMEKNRGWEDGWGSPMRLRVARVDGELKYVFVSAGADQRFGTEDDVTFDRLRRGG